MTDSRHYLKSTIIHSTIYYVILIIYYNNNSVQFHINAKKN